VSSTKAPVSSTQASVSSTQASVPSTQASTSSTHGYVGNLLISLLCVLTPPHHKGDLLKPITITKKPPCCHYSLLFLVVLAVESTNSKRSLRDSNQTVGPQCSALSLPKPAPKVRFLKGVCPRYCLFVIVRRCCLWAGRCCEGNGSVLLLVHCKIPQGCRFR